MRKHSRSKPLKSLTIKKIWPIASLLLTTIIGPLIVWNVQQGRIDKTRLELEYLEYELLKKETIVNMYGKLSAALAELQVLILDRYALLNDTNGESRSELDIIQNKILQKRDEIAYIKGTIFDLTGDELVNYFVFDPSIPIPRNLRVRE